MTVEVFEPQHSKDISATVTIEKRVNKESFFYNYISVTGTVSTTAANCGDADDISGTGCSSRSANTTGSATMERHSSSYTKYAIIKWSYCKVVKSLKQRHANDEQWYTL